MIWNLRMAAAKRDIWRASDMQRLLAEHGLVISKGKMSNLWSGKPVTLEVGGRPRRHLQGAGLRSRRAAATRTGQDPATGADRRRTAPRRERLRFPAAAPPAWIPQPPADVNARKVWTWHPRVCSRCNANPIAGSGGKKSYLCWWCAFPASQLRRARCAAPRSTPPRGYCRTCHPRTVVLSSCQQCLGWGLHAVPGFVCPACTTFSWRHPGGECASCREAFPVVRAYCRLCWHQAQLSADDGADAQPAGAAEAGLQLFPDRDAAATSKFGDTCEEARRAGMCWPSGRGPTPAHPSAVATVPDAIHLREAPGQPGRSQEANISSPRCSTRPTSSRKAAAGRSTYARASIARCVC